MIFRVSYDLISVGVVLCLFTDNKKKNDEFNYR